MITRKVKHKIHVANSNSYSTDVNRNLPFGTLIALKDNLVTTEQPTTCASHMLEGFRGVSASTVAQLLEKGGFQVVAKTNMDEYGMGSHSINSAFGAVSHGIGTQKMSVGGSSGGSARVVAGHAVQVAIGTDTGGSVRLPAAYCGIVGFKPSYGMISRNGLVPYANSLDTVGILATNVRDCLTVFRSLNKHDPADPTSLSKDSRYRMSHALLARSQGHVQSTLIRGIGQRDKDETAQISLQAKRRWYGNRAQYLPTKRRIGVPQEYNIREMNAYVRQGWLRTLSALTDMGHEVVSISLPHTRQALSAYYVLAPAEASSNLAKYDGVRYGKSRDSNIADNEGGVLYANHRGTYFGDEVKRRILLGTFSLSAGAMDNYFIQAQKVRRLVQSDFNNVFRFPHPLMDNSSENLDGVDYIVVPTAPSLPPLHSDLAQQSLLDSYVNDVFTVPASLAGLPAVSVPVLPHEDLPPHPDRNIGMQVIGQFGDDIPILNFARQTVEVMDRPRHTTGSDRLWQNRRR